MSRHKDLKPNLKSPKEPTEVDQYSHGTTAPRHHGTTAIPPATENQSVAVQQNNDQQEILNEVQNQTGNENNENTPEPRRSQRKKTSTFDKHLKDYYR